MQGKKTDPFKTHALTINCDQDRGYIYDSEPANWPSKNTASNDLCSCPNCGSTTEHKCGIPCFVMKCINCGTQMVSKKKK